MAASTGPEGGHATRRPPVERPRADSEASTRLCTALFPRPRAQCAPPDGATGPECAAIQYADPEQLSLAALRAAADAYRTRPREDARAVLHEKLRGAARRAAQRDALLAEAERRAAAGAPFCPRTLVDGLLAIGVRLDDGALARLRDLIPDPALCAEVLAAQGRRCPQTPALDALAGPDLDLEIEVNRDSPWPFERWRAERRFAEYQFEDGGVRYRGLHLRPGDLLLPNVNLDGNFVYSALSDPKGFCPHSALVAILEHDGARYPAVVETYEKGLRAVPLCVFLNERYVSYVEVYRHRGLDAPRAQRASAVLLAAAERARGYNFDTTDPDPDYVCCTSVTQQFYAALGLPGVERPGAIRDAGIRRNMQALDYPHLDAFLTPIDFVLCPQLEFVGLVDNGQPARLLAREFVERRFRHCFATGRIDPVRLPLAVRVNHFGIRQMRARTPLGRVVSRVMGFDHANLPKGPDRILAIVEPLEAELGAAVRRLVPEVQARLDELAGRDVADFLRDPELCARADALLPMRWLRPA